MNTKLRKIAKYMMIALFAEALIVFGWHQNDEAAVVKDYRKNLMQMALLHANAINAAYPKFVQERYRATGSNVYERIYNTPKQSITELIRRLAEEAMPQGWECRVEVEEFTHFLLMAYVGQNQRVPSAQTAAKYLAPVMRYAGEYLSNASIYDRTHRRRLFFDTEALLQFESTKAIYKSGVYEQAKSFTRFNSVKVDCQKVGNHFLVPVIVYGQEGAREVTMLLDTGASMTTISLKIAQETGQENLNTVRRESFQTASGTVEWPIVTRVVSVSNVDKQQPVAVSIEDNISLLGVDYFANKNYLLDAENECLYFWDRKR